MYVYDFTDPKCESVEIKKMISASQIKFITDYIFCT